MRGPCIHFASYKLHDAPRACGRAGEGVELVTPAGRPNARGGPYCAAHGGVALAFSNAVLDWNHAAPASVGDAAAVQRAGTMALCTEHAYVVIRSMPDHVWLAFLGVGTHLTEVENPHATLQRYRSGRVRLSGSRLRPKGACAFPSRVEALSAGVMAWRQCIEARVAEIRVARGGTLTWGLAVEPLVEPIIVEAGPGECASEIATRARRVGRTGVAVFSGNRPTGEFA